jgi:hypothetical protein
MHSSSVHEGNSFFPRIQGNVKLFLWLWKYLHADYVDLTDTENFKWFLCIIKGSKHDVTVTMKHHCCFSL